MKTPSEALPSEDLKNFLRAFSQDEKNTVFIISGRDAQTLEDWLGDLPLNFIAEHGAFIKYKNGEWESQTTIPSEWKNEIRPMLESYAFRCAGSFIEEKKHALTWHYRNTHPGLGFVRSRELLNHLLQLTVNSPVQVIDGNKVLEVRLTGLDKGITALKVIDIVRPDFTLCLGDDTTDEDMFKAIDGKGYTIKIGTGATSANYNISSQTEVLQFLKAFIE
jgi:trehalose 6-phosphate synthase/phosphatase